MLGQFSLFEREIRTEEEFVEEMYKLYKQSGDAENKEPFDKYVKRHFKGRYGGTCGGSLFGGYDFYDYSPEGVRLTKWNPREEVFFRKDRIIAISKQLKEGLNDA